MVRYLANAEFDMYLKRTEEQANQFNLRCLLFTMLFPVIIWVLNELNIFIIEETLMDFSMFSSLLIGMIVITICRIMGLTNPWTKYFVIASIVVITTIIGMTLTYHATLLVFLPALYASQYSNKRIIFFTYIATVIGVFISVMGGYYFGICDANMVLLTTKPMAEYLDQQGNFVVEGVNQNPWVTLPLYYVLPRSFLLLASLPIINHISTGIANRAVKENYLRRRIEIDDMTQIYNKNKFLQMKKNYYPKVSQLAVIYIDVNGLKTVNDENGHEYGDELIYEIACSIKDTIKEKENENSFRVGGDEFVVILEAEDESMTQEWIRSWKRNMGHRNKSSHVKLSASAGYAIGEGKNIEELIHIADQNMYLDKQRRKK